jgi:uncharacterized sulfatase
MKTQSLRPIGAILLLALGLLTAGNAHAAADRTRPNILMVLVDDLGYADFSCYGGRVKTPNVDRLAAEGIRFTHFCVNSPICSPSRTALITGQYPARWRITSYIDNRGLNERRGMAQFLDLKAPSLARFLKQAGYSTGHFGKWHMGGGRDVGEAPLITDYGFDASLTQFEGLGDRVLPLLDVHDGTPAPKMPLGVASEKLGRGKVTWVDRCQVTKAFVDRALEFIKQAEGEGKPFYVNVWPDDVHSPFFPPKELRGDGSKHALYDGALANMDTQLGPLLDYIRQSPKLRDNTLILLLSDNGPEPGAGSAGTLRGTKGSLFEGGFREPLISWGPGLVDRSQRRECDAVLSSVDLNRSLLKVAGVTPPAEAAPDGEDLSGTLLGKIDAGRKGPLFWNRPPDRPGPPANPWPDLAVRDGKWKLCLWASGKSELYDLEQDEAEAHNVAGEHADVTARLKAELEAWDKTLPH